MTIAIYDNPNTQSREGYKDGKLLFALSYLYVDCPPMIPLDEFKVLRCSDFIPGEIYGDVLALPYSWTSNITTVD